MRVIGSDPILGRNLLIVLIAALIHNVWSPNLWAQPTYKLDVKPHLKPLSTLKLDGNQVVRTELADDPGFRLQFHIRQADGKTVSTLDARAEAIRELPTKTAGNFTVVLELFHPAYKGGTSQKGEFKSVSNVISFKVEGGKIIPVESPKQKK
jgi:hypothetical protein